MTAIETKRSDAGRLVWRQFRRLAWLLLVLLALAAGWATFALLASRAQLDGEARIPGLSAPAELARDAAGIVIVSAADVRDAARALGFVHAQERWLEMDLLRRSAAGELAALFGPAALPRDREVRVHRMRARMQANLARLPDAHRALLDAYAEGANAGLEALGARPWAYWLLRQSPQPWRAEDSLLVAAAMAFDLHDENNRRELALHRLRRHLPDPVVDLLAADGTPWDAPLMGEPRPLPVLPTLPASAEAPLPGATAAEVGALEVDPGVAGSNNFAVAGALTADGRALVADDMHLGLRAPNIWFRARLRYAEPSLPGGLADVSGVSLPGLPGIVVGSNGHVAWGFTNSYGDWLDWVRVEWVDRAAGRYRTAEGEAQVAAFDERIEVAGGDAESLTVRETIWGPLLHDEADGSALALMWTMHRPGGIDLTLTAMNHAVDLDAVVAVAHASGLPPQNLVAGDRSGRIGWALAGRIPVRLGGCDAQRPLDPSAGCDWAPDWLDPASAPRLLDPADGRLWTANSRVADGEALRLIGTGGYDLGARQRQIRERLLERERFAEADLMAIQLDAEARFMQRWWQRMRDVLAGAGDDPALQRLEAASRAWEGEARPDAVVYRLAREFRTAVLRELADRLLAPARAAEGDDFVAPGLNQFEAVADAVLAQQPEGWLDPGVDPDAWLRDVARRFVTQIESEGALAERRWGARNAARICHPLAGALPSPLSDMLCRPADELPGDSHLPRVQGPQFGASQRMVVSPGREREGLMHAPAGQSGHPLSPFWDSGHADWVEGRASPFLPGEAVHRVALSPR